MIGEAYAPIKSTPPDGGKSALWSGSPRMEASDLGLQAATERLLAAGSGIVKVEVIDPSKVKACKATPPDWGEFGLTNEQVAPAPRKHSHYFKDVSRLQTVDVYRVLSLFGVADQALGHAIKKLLVAGGRGVKEIDRDVQEAIDTLMRWQEMRAEDSRER